jgi:hypothetical protein
MMYGVVALRKTYAIGGKFLGARDEQDDAQHDGKDKNVPLPDYDHHTRLLAVQVVVLDPT